MTLSSTTLSLALGAGDRIVSLASVSGIATPSAVSGLDPVDCLVVGGEAVRVTRVIPGSTAVEVERGMFGSRVAAHASGATVYLARAGELYQQDPVGDPPSVPDVLPWINTVSGLIWFVIEDAWVPADGAGASFPATSDGVSVLLAAGPVDRTVVITATVTATFADGDTGTQPTFEIGQTGTADKFVATSEFTDAELGDVVSATGILTAGTDLIVTAVAATNDGTGAISVSVLYTT